MDIFFFLAFTEADAVKRGAPLRATLQNLVAVPLCSTVFTFLAEAASPFTVLGGGCLSHRGETIKSHVLHLYLQT